MGTAAAAAAAMSTRRSACIELASIMAQVQWHCRPNSKQSLSEAALPAVNSSAVLAAKHKPKHLLSPYTCITCINLQEEGVSTIQVGPWCVGADVPGPHGDNGAVPRQQHACGQGHLTQAVQVCISRHCCCQLDVLVLEAEAARKKESVQMIMWLFHSTVLTAPCPCSAAARYSGTKSRSLAVCR